MWCSRNPQAPLWIYAPPLTPEVARAFVEQGAAIAAGIIALGEWAMRCSRPLTVAEDVDSLGVRVVQEELRRAGHIVPLDVVSNAVWALLAERNICRDSARSWWLRCRDALNELARVGYWTDAKGMRFCRECGAEASEHAEGCQLAAVEWGSLREP